VPEAPQPDQTPQPAQEPQPALAPADVPSTAPHDPVEHSARAGHAERDAERPSDTPAHGDAPAVAPRPAFGAAPPQHPAPARHPSEDDVMLDGGTYSFAPRPAQRPAGEAPAQPAWSVSTAPPQPAWSGGAVPAPPPPSPDPITPAAFPGFDTPTDAAPRSAAALPSSEVRKIVTIIFSDLKGSTALTEKIDAEAINEVKERYFTAMAAEITRHGGKIEKYIGDAIMAVFGLPRAHEDDALRAVRAAHGMTVAMNELNKDLLAFYGVEIAARTGVNTGEVVANSDPNAEQRLATGDAVNVAARLEQAAPANEVLIGEVTYSLVRSYVDVEEVEPLELKGKAERVPAFRLLNVRDAAAMESQASTGDAVLVGREHQLEQLRAGLREVASRGGARITAVLGEAGVGKSYLVDAFQDEVRPATIVLRGRCLPYGDGITFWPLVEVVRSAAGIVDDDTPQDAVDKIEATLGGASSATEIRDRLASIAGLTTARFPVTEIFWGARKFLEALSARRPVVLCIEDVHNAEETFLDLLEHLLDTTAPQSALLVIATGRLALAEKRPGWVDRPGVTLLAVPALKSEDTQRLVEVLLDGPVDDEVKERVVTSSEGNPLFVSQLVSMLVDKGLVHRHEDRWTASGDLATASVPPTIQALLAARLDDLSREERAILEPASVIGLAFPEPAIEELVPDSLRRGVAAHLRTLSRKQFLDRDAVTASEDEIYRFRNLMIKDAVYGSLLKRARATMHERFVAWAERVNAERGRETEFEEIHGYHLEQAYRYRIELGPLDAEGRSIAERASAKLSNAGRRAMNRGDIPASVSLLKRAAAVLPGDSPARLDIMFDLGETLIQHGDLEEAKTLIDEGIRVAGEIGDERRRARMMINELMHDQFTGSGSWAQQIERAKEVIEVLERHNDDFALARAWNEVVFREVTRGQYAAATRSSDRLVEHARRAGSERLAGQIAPAVAYLMVHGATPVTEGIKGCDDVLESIRGNRKTEAIVLGALAQLKAMDGSFDEARALCERVRGILTELQARIDANSTSIEASRVEIRAGELEAAEVMLRRDEEALAGLEEQYFRSSIAGILANVLALRGSFDDAERYAALSQSLSDDEDLESQISWRTARAKVLAHRGEHGEAVALAQEAVRLASEGEDVEVKADSLMELGRVFSMIGRRESSGPPLREALGLYELKGDRSAIVLVNELLADLAAA
jgi:class 3 adenylate cyclase/tetratricopeptide (TPR) repeat protein